MVRFRALRSHVQDGVPLTEAAHVAGVPLRTMQRWVARYLDNGLAGLARRRRADAGQRRLPAAIVEAIKTLALGKPRLSAAAIRRRLGPLVEAQDWPVPSYAAVHAIVRDLDPGLVTLAHEGTVAYRNRFELIHRHRADRPNAIWQADHTQLDLLILDANAKPVRPDPRHRLPLTFVAEVRLVRPQDLAHGIPRHVQFPHDLLHRPLLNVISPPDPRDRIHPPHLPSVRCLATNGLTKHQRGQDCMPKHRRGKVERFFGTMNREFLPYLPGCLVKGKPVSAPALTLSDLDKALGAFIIVIYNARLHSGIGIAPQQAWRAEGWFRARNSSIASP